MSPDGLHHDLCTELDGRFPSGRWHGWWQQLSARGKMELDLSFARGRICGDGRDWVGDFVLSGNYNPAVGSCALLKSYLGQHDVDYDGVASETGIRGTWRLIDRESRQTVDCGPFHIWPVSRGVGELHTLLAAVPILMP
jgi:hypothetical protein